MGSRQQVTSKQVSIRTSEKLVIGSEQFMIIDVPGDGDCLFHSLEALLRPTSSSRGNRCPNAREISVRVMDFYRSAPTTLRNYLEHQWPQDDSFQERLRKMTRDQHEWGIQMDVIAAATAYDVNIRCLSTVGPHGQRFDELVRASRPDGSPNPAATTSRRILYYRFGSLHYQYGHPLM